MLKPRLGNGGKFSQGEYVLINPSKYIGTLPILYRSSWEHKMMRFLDEHQSVLFWASESLAISYFNVLTNKPAKYYPDFLIVYIDKSGKQHREIVEIKPSHETIMEKARSKRDKLSVVLNQCKWKAARIFAKKNNMEFRVVTENEIWGRK